MADGPLVDDLVGYLQRAREALLWKLEGLSEHDARRPLTPTGTNLLGLVKHVASYHAWYFGACFDRPFPEPMPWIDEDAEPNADMWATAEETRDWVLDLSARAWNFAQGTIRELPLDARGHVPWWSPERARPTLHTVLVHQVAETQRHAGHADVLREQLDGRAGLRPDATNLPEVEEQWWASYRSRLQQVADSFR